MEIEKETTLSKESQIMEQLTSEEANEQSENEENEEEDEEDEEDEDGESAGVKKNGELLVGNKKPKRKREIEETATKTGMQDDTGDDSSDSNEFKNSKSKSLPPSSSDSSANKKPRKLIGKKQAGKVTFQSSPKERGAHSPKTITLEDKKSTPTSENMEIENREHSTEESESGGNGRDKGKRENLDRGRKQKPSITKTKGAPRQPKKKSTKNPSSLSGIEEPAVPSETLANKKSQQSTVLTKTEVEIIFDLTIGCADWSNITEKLKATSGTNMLSKNLKRHCMTVLKRNILNGYID